MRRAEVGVLLHELGHNLGLTHGGARPRRHATHKPNYLSVMNYHHTFGFVRLVGSGAEFFPYRDYSRARSSLVHERRLREMVGIALPETAAFTDNAAGDELLGLTYCPDEALAAFRWNRPVNFDCDEAIEGGKVKVDTNLDGKKNKLGRVQVDWDHLVFDGGALGDGSGLAPSLVLDPWTRPTGRRSNGSCPSSSGSRNGPSSDRIAPEGACRPRSALMVPPRLPRARLSLDRVPGLHPPAAAGSRR